MEKWDKFSGTEVVIYLQNLSFSERKKKECWFGVCLKNDNATINES